MTIEGTRGDFVFGSAEIQLPPPALDGDRAGTLAVGGQIGVDFWHFWEVRRERGKMVGQGGTRGAQT